MEKSRNHPEFTFIFNYQKYVQQVEEHFGYKQFIEYYHRKYNELKGSIKLEHIPGNEMFIDFAGKKLQIIDKDLGEVVPVEVFVAILPNNQYISMWKFLEIRNV